MNNTLLSQPARIPKGDKDIGQVNIFERIIERLPAPVIVFDKDLCFLTASDRFFNESPLSKKNIKPGDYWYNIVPDMPIKWKMIHQRCLKGESIKIDEDPFYRQDGSTEWWRWEIVPWYLGRDEIGGLILYVENITDEKKTEKELRKNIHLLEKSNNNLSKFAHMCAHDLHQSLRTISLYTQMIESNYYDKLDTTFKKYVRRTVDTIDQMRNFINGLLDFSHLKNEKIKLSPVCLQEIADTVVMMLKDEIIHKQAKITYKNLPTVNANKSLIFQVVQNLISNALKYNGKAIPIIDIKAADKKEFWLISIHDNGMGIEEKYLKKIFNEYKRLNHSEEKGSGLGLTQCNKVIKEHGGRIWATSSAGQGTSILFTLPKAETIAGSQEIKGNAVNS